MERCSGARGERASRHAARCRMSRTLILRYSNAEGVNTVQEHQAIIDAHRSVWWGWWKKDHEPMNVAALRFVEQETSRSALRIGLVNRKDGELYVGTCTGIRFVQEHGTKIVCPDVDKCPAYYSQDQFPAWFLFERF